MGVVSVQNNTTDVVDIASDETHLDEGKNFNEIQESIINANESDTIKINGTYNTSTVKFLTITKAITIEGDDDTVFDGETISSKFILQNHLH